MKNYKYLLISKNSSLSKAIKKINENSIKFSQKVIFVVDNNNKLLGSITDGDIRRAIIKNNSLLYKVEDVMNPSPKFINLNNKDQDIKNLSDFELATPIINSKKIVKDIYFSSYNKNNKKINNLVVIMAGGLGKRLRPLTSKTPKPLIKIDNKPILEIIIDNFKKYGFENYYISTFYKSNVIKKYFRDGKEFDIKIKYLNEKSPLGTAGALALLDKKIIKDPFILVNGDVITKINYDLLLAFHKENKNDVTICSKNYFVEIPYGILSFSKKKVSEIIEKPSFNYQVNTGIYVFSPKILKEFKNVERIDMNNLIKKLIQKKYIIKSYPLHEYWVDIGEMQQFEKAKKDIIYNKYK